MLQILSHALATAAQDFSLAVFEGPGKGGLAIRALDATEAWHLRLRKLGAPLVFWFSVQLMLFREDSIQVVLERLLRVLRERGEGVTPRDVTPEAACKARYRLGHEPLRFAFEETAAAVQPAPTFRGLCPFAIDGTKADMPDTEANAAFFGRPEASRGHAAFPQVSLVTLVDTASLRVCGVEYGTCHAPERPAGLRLLRRLGAGDLALVDRGFSSHEFLLEAALHPAHFVARVSSHWGLHPVKSLEDGSSLVDLTVRVPLPPEQQTRWRKTFPVVLRLRLVTYQVDEEDPIRLLTDLLDPTGYPAEEIAELYHQRWSAELQNAEGKVTLAATKHGRLATVFRSKGPEGVLQEIYAMYLAYNLIRGAMVEAGEVHGVPPRELSFTRSLQVIREAIPRFDAASPEELSWRREQLLEDLAFCRLDRPERKRSNQRVVKQKMSNFGVKKPGMKGAYRDFKIRVIPGPRPETGPGAKERWRLQRSPP